MGEDLTASPDVRTTTQVILINKHEAYPGTSWDLEKGSRPLQEPESAQTRPGGDQPVTQDSVKGMEALWSEPAQTSQETDEISVVHPTGQSTSASGGL